MTKNLFYVFAFIFVACLALWMASYFLSYLYYFGWMIFWLLLLLGVFFLGFQAFKPKLPLLALPKKTQYKVVDVTRQHVYAFRTEPTLRDLVLLSDELRLAEMELSGDVIQLDNNTAIKVVEDAGGESVKIKIKAKKKEEEVWVARTAIVESTPVSKGKLKG